MGEELVRIEPQPLNGRPFRIASLTIEPDVWFNEHIRWPWTGRMLFMWKCPLGPDAEPVRVDGVWYWRRVAGNGEVQRGG